MATFLMTGALACLMPPPPNFVEANNTDQLDCIAQADSSHSSGPFQGPSSSTSRDTPFDLDEFTDFCLKQGISGCTTSDLAWDSDSGSDRAAEVCVPSVHSNSIGSRNINISRTLEEFNDFCLKQDMSGGNMFVSPVATDAGSHAQHPPRATAPSPVYWNSISGPHFKDSAGNIQGGLDLAAAPLQSWTEQQQTSLLNHTPLLPSTASGLHLEGGTNPPVFLPELPPERPESLSDFTWLLENLDGFLDSDNASGDATFGEGSAFLKGGSSPADHLQQQTAALHPPIQQKVSAKSGYSCKYCQTRLRTGGGLWKHLVGKHLNIPEVAKATTQSAGSAKCKFCNKIYKSQLRCQEHIRSLHKGGSKLNFEIGTWDGIHPESWKGQARTVTKRKRGTGFLLDHHSESNGTARATSPHGVSTVAAACASPGFSQKNLTVSRRGKKESTAKRTKSRRGSQERGLELMTTATQPEAPTLNPVIANLKNPLLNSAREPHAPSAELSAGAVHSASSAPASQDVLGTRFPESSKARKFKCRYCPASLASCFYRTKHELNEHGMWPGAVGRPRKKMAYGVSCKITARRGKSSSPARALIESCHLKNLDPSASPTPRIASRPSSPTQQSASKPPTSTRRNSARRPAGRASKPSSSTRRNSTSRPARRASKVPFSHGKWNCRYCSAVFPSKYFFDKHEKEEHQGKDEVKINKTGVTCAYCPAGFKDPSGLWKHMVTKHPSKVKKTSKHSVEEADCPSCGKSYQSNFQLQNHVRWRHPDLFRCDRCKKSFSGFRTLWTHSKNKHGIDLPQEDPAGSKRTK